MAAPLIQSLRLRGHDVLYVAESAAGLRDAEVIQLAVNGGRLLLTEDKDFGDLVFRRGFAVPGIVLMRLGTPDAVFQMMRLMAAVERYGEQLFGHYVVVEDGRLRSRPLRSKA